MSKKRHEGKTVTVLNPDGRYISKCTPKKATSLLCSDRAVRVSATVVRLNETKKMRKEAFKRIIEKSGRRCYICGEVIPEEEPATIDHIVPKSRDYFSGAYGNLRCCCVRCNSAKRNMMPKEFLRYIDTHRDQFPYLTDERIDSLGKELSKYWKRYNRQKRRKYQKEKLDD